MGKSMGRAAEAKKNKRGNEYPQTVRTSAIEKLKWLAENVVAVYLRAGVSSEWLQGRGLISSIDYGISIEREKEKSKPRWTAR